MEEEEDKPPFWLHTTDNRRGRRRGQSSSLLSNNGAFVIFLVLIALAFIFFIIPSFLSFTSQNFSPHSVKKGWNSLNFVLVLFAIVCGFFSGNGSNENGGPDGSYSGDSKFSSTSNYDRVQGLNSLTPRKWYEFSDRNSLRRMRSSSSYPDLRLEPPWTADDGRWRFYDDTRVYDYYGSTSNQLYHRRLLEEREEEGGIWRPKDIVVDSFVTRVSHAPTPESSPQVPSLPVRPVSPPAPRHQASTPSPPRRVSPPPRPESPPLAPSSPPPPPPPKVVRRKPKRTYQDLEARKANSEIRDHQPLTSPPQAPPLFENSSRSEKKRGSATKDFLNSLRRMKKKQRQRSVENLDSLFNPEPASTRPLYPPPSPPPPPPPPPPPAFFHNIFSTKKNKAKKIQSPAPPPPPPPPPAPLEARASRIVTQKAPVTTRKPLLPSKISTINNIDENADSGNESPLIPIPPPPPPPPFKMPDWKFVVQGDFVRLKSIQSSRSESPDSDGFDDPSSGESSPLKGKEGKSDGGDSSTAMFCPSPDVDTKADSFIARFRAGLQLEKMNSGKRRERSNLGPNLDPRSDTLQP